VIKRILINAAALAGATWLLPGITLGSGDTAQTILTFLAAGAILGILNLLVRPILKLISLPFIVVTLGLFLWVINAGVLLILSSACESLGIGWRVLGWQPALLGAAIVSLINWLLTKWFEDDK